MDTLEVNGVERPPQSSLKRSRSPEVKLAQLRKAGGVDDVLTDNLRSQKRYLSQVRSVLLLGQPAARTHPLCLVICPALWLTGEKVLSSGDGNRYCQTEYGSSS